MMHGSSSGRPRDRSHRRYWRSRSQRAHERRTAQLRTRHACALNSALPPPQHVWKGTSNSHDGVVRIYDETAQKGDGIVERRVPATVRHGKTIQGGMATESYSSDHPSVFNDAVVLGAGVRQIEDPARLAQRETTLLQWPMPRRADERSRQRAPVPRCVEPSTPPKRVIGYAALEVFSAVPGCANHPTRVSSFGRGMLTRREIPQRPPVRSRPRVLR